MKDFFTIFLTGVAIGICLICKWSLFWGFIVAIGFCAILQKGQYKPKEALRKMVKATAEIWPLYVIIFLIGASVSVWLSGGIVQTLMVWGLQIMVGHNVVLMTFLITALAGLFLGTAVGTVSTFGIAILGVGKAFQIPLPLLLGAVVSGAFVSDKISPLSGLMNLTLKESGASYKEAVKVMLITLLPTVFITGIIYTVLGNSYVTGQTKEMTLLIEEVQEHFLTHPLILILPILVVGLALLGKSTIMSISVGIVCAVALSIFVQGQTLRTIMIYMLMGYKVDMSAQLSAIFHSGGVLGMVEVVLVVVGAMVFSVFLELSGTADRIFGKFFTGVKKEEKLLIRCGLMSIFMTTLTCDQTVGIVMPLKIMKRKSPNLSSAILARTISDTGTIVAPLMPWNVNALIITGITGVSALSYGPYACLCFVAPLVSFLGCFVRPKYKS